MDGGRLARYGGNHGQGEGWGDYFGLNRYGDQEFEVVKFGNGMVSIKNDAADVLTGFGDGKCEFNPPNQGAQNNQQLWTLVRVHNIF